MKRKIWIDCDPGIDDAVAIAVAIAHREELDILGISSVAGNQTIDRTTGNALKLTSFLGAMDIPVARGSACPLPIWQRYFSHCQRESRQPWFP